MAAAVNGGEAKATGAENTAPVICPGHTRPVSDVSYTNMTEDGYFLVSSCLDGKPMLRDGSTGDWIGTFSGHKGAAHSARLNESCTQAVTASGDFSVKLWDAMTGNELLTLEHKHVVKCAIFSKDGTRIYTGGHEKKLRVYELKQQTIAPTATATATASAAAADAAPAATTVTTASSPLVLEGCTGIISHIMLTADPNLILTGGAEKGVRIWDIAQRKTVATLPTNSEVTSITRSLDDRVISIAAGRDVYFYECTKPPAAAAGSAAASSDAAAVGVPYGLTLLRTYKLPRDLSAVAYHPKVGRFVTGSSTELWVRLYDYETANELACNKGHHGPVRCVAIDPFGTHYASGSEDGTIRIFPMPLPDAKAAPAATAAPAKVNGASK